MPSSGKTQNYDLNQWVRSDPFVMDDFNSDNEKIDAAIKYASDKAHDDALREAIDAIPIKKLMDTTINGPESFINIEIDLNGLDLSPYAYLDVYVIAPRNHKPYEDLAFYVNGISSGYLFASRRTVLNWSGDKSVIYLLENHFRIDLLFTAPTFSNTSSEYLFRAPNINKPEDLSSLSLMSNFYSSNHFYNGTRIIITGVKL